MRCGAGWRWSDRKEKSFFFHQLTAVIRFDLFVAGEKLEGFGFQHLLLSLTKSCHFIESCAKNISTENIGCNGCEISRKLQLEWPNRHPTSDPLPRLQNNSRLLFLFLFVYDAKLKARGAPDSGYYYPAGNQISRIVKNYPAG